MDEGIRVVRRETRCRDEHAGSRPVARLRASRSLAGDETQPHGTLEIADRVVLRVDSRNADIEAIPDALRVRGLDEE